MPHSINATAFIDPFPHHDALQAQALGVQANLAFDELLVGHKHVVFPLGPESDGDKALFVEHLNTISHRIEVAGAFIVHRTLDIQPDGTTGIDHAFLKHSTASDATLCERYLHQVSRWPRPHTMPLAIAHYEAVTAPEPVLTLGAAVTLTDRRQPNQAWDVLYTPRVLLGQEPIGPRGINFATHAAAAYLHDAVKSYLRQLAAVSPPA